MRKETGGIKMVAKNISNQVIRHVLTATDQKFADLSVGTLAYSFKIDRFKLLRQFKRQTDMTLEDFLLREKMARAAFLLKAYVDIPVKEVSERIGFCTCDYFIRKFKSFYGLPPGRYREFKTGYHGHGGRENRKGAPGRGLFNMVTPTRTYPRVQFRTGEKDA